DNFRYSQRARIEDLQHCLITSCQGGRVFCAPSCATTFGWSSQRRFHLVASQRFGKNLPLLRRLDIQSWVVVDFVIQQQVAIQMPERRKLSSHTAAIHLMGKK